jgi:hypothetical protein
MAAIRRILAWVPYYTLCIYVGMMFATHSAHASLVLMVGPHAPSVGYTPHIGPVGYTSGGSHTVGPGEFLRNSPVLQHALARMRAARCKVLHAEYVARHGLTTPQPLEGFSGCKKWAMDASYWRERRYGWQKVQVNAIAAIQQEAAITAHNLVFG